MTLITDSLRWMNMQLPRSCLTSSLLVLMKWRRGTQSWMDVSVSVTRRGFFQAKRWIRRFAVLNLVDCKTNAQGTLFANKELDEYKVNYMVAMLDHWGHTAVFLQTDQEPATTQMRRETDVRSHWHNPSRVLDTLKEPTG